MDILIDGYNLLHQSPFLTRDRALGWVERARERLLIFLDSKQSSPPAAMTVVFDASRGKVHSDHFFRGIEVLFANEYEEADDLIEVLIRKHSHPQSLTVVSSDHRIQTIASRRNASPVDSDIWLDRWSRPLSQREGASHRDRANHWEGGEGEGSSGESDANHDFEKFQRRTVELTDDEKRKWLDEFGFS